VKREYTKRHWETSNDYADAKDAVVRTIMRRARGEGSGPRIERFAALVLGYLPKHARILEIGAGEGLLSARLAAAGHDVVALDTQLRSRFPIVETSFEEYEAPPHSFDCVAAQLVLHHATDLHAMLDKIEMLLNGGGIIAIDDYGWERSDDEAFRAERSDLHTSNTMLRALRERFAEIFYADHAYFQDGAGDDSLAFTFIGARKS
jgi:2-polyprenyl-3-methyl-5-hydroxy-6-metoxy-1,4-benzoquinol methylase